MISTPIQIDLSYLYSITDGDKSFEQILLTGTVSDVDSLVSGLQTSWKGHDAAGIRRSAHSLVSLAAIAGMPQVTDWSRKLDEAFADGMFHPELVGLADNIILGWPAVKTQLEKMIGKN